MQRRFLVFAAAAGLAWALAGPDAFAKDDRPFVSENGRYAVRFPGKPREETQSTKTPAGDLNVHTAVYAQADGTVFSVVYTDYKADVLKNVDPNILLNAARDGLKGNDGNLLEDKDDPFGPDKLPSRLVVVDKGKSRLRVRLIIRDARLYQVLVLGPKDAADKSSAGFLGSFELRK